MAKLKFTANKHLSRWNHGGRKINSGETFECADAEAKTICESYPDMLTLVSGSSKAAQGAAENKSSNPDTRTRAQKAADTRRRNAVAKGK